MWPREEAGGEVGTDCFRFWRGWCGEKGPGSAGSMVLRHGD